MKPLTSKQQRFVEEYLVDLNATQACIRAGYSKKNADKIGPALLGNSRVAAAIAKAKAERTKRTKIDADWVLNYLTEIAQADHTQIYDSRKRLKPFSKWPPVLRRLFRGLKKDGEAKFVNADPKGIGELIGKHIDVNAFRERHEFSGPDGGPIEGKITIEFVKPTPSDS